MARHSTSSSASLSLAWTRVEARWNSSETDWNPRDLDPLWGSTLRRTELFRALSVLSCSIPCSGLASVQPDCLLWQTKIPSNNLQIAHVSDLALTTPTHHPGTRRCALLGRSCSCTAIHGLCTAKQNSNGSGINGTPCSPSLMLSDLANPTVVILPMTARGLSTSCPNEMAAGHLQKLAQHSNMLAKHCRCAPTPSIGQHRGPGVEIGCQSYRVANTVRAGPCSTTRTGTGRRPLSTSAPNCLAEDFASNLRKKVPVAIPRTPPSLFDNAVIVGQDEQLRCFWRCSAGSSDPGAARYKRKNSLVHPP